jgi:hypothetical protein
MESQLTFWSFPRELETKVSSKLSPDARFRA